MKRYFFVFFYCMIFSSCMISTVYSKKEFKEKIPCHIDKGVYLSGIYFENNQNSIPLILWKLDYINKKAKGITLCFTNGLSYFPENKSVDVKYVRIKYKNEKEFITELKNVAQKEGYRVYDDIDYSFCEVSENFDLKGSAGLIIDSDGTYVSFKHCIAPEGYVGEYRIILEFDDIVNLSKADTLELKILITEGDETTEVTKVFHFDMQYTSSTESMFSAWIRSY